VAENFIAGRASGFKPGDRVMAILAYGGLAAAAGFRNE
jgi:hypothetical protein